MDVKRFGSLVATVVTAAAAMVLSPGAALASSVAHDRPVSVVPQAGTPNVDDGAVFAVAQVGNTLVVGGSFTTVGGAARRAIFAMDVNTRAVSATFAPVLDGDVKALLPGPTAGTVYVGGAFNNVGGVRAKGLVLLDVGTGARVTAFRALAMNGVVNSLDRAGNRLFVGGTFTSIGGLARAGIASTDATTGAVDSFAQNTVATNHNWTSTNGGAKAPVGVTDLAVTPDASKLVMIGNFKTVDGLPRDQVAVLDLTGSQAVVKPDYRIRGYEPACFWWAFDSYVRDLDIAPDGTWFAIATTGGGNTTLCDTVARFDLSASGDDVQPVWRSVSGGDSLLSVAVSGPVVYTGGHQRWMNNDNASDAAGGGAVPRPGLAALDARNGMPIAWNPGRNPRGAGAWTTYLTPAGLWVGSDTDWIGDFEFRRQKLAFFPLAGGVPLADETPQGLPGGVYVGNAQGGSPVLYRVNAGGPAVPSADTGPDWASDAGPTSPFRNSGSNAATWPPGASLDGTVPAGTPAALFESERWDPGTKNDGGELQWAFPVQSGQEVEVRLFLANRCGCTSGAGQRRFDVTLEGATVLDDFDIVAATGDQRGTMRSFTVTSDGTVNLGFGHEVENPLVNAVEIRKTGPVPPVTATFGRRDFTGTSAGDLVPMTTPLDLTATRGTVLIGEQLFYGKSDNNLYRRTFDGETFGAESLVDPYNDPVWSTVDTGSGQTFRGAKPNFYGELGSLGSMFYENGRLYYTLLGQTGLFYRTFSPDSGIVRGVRSQVPGVTMPDVSGAFLAGGTLFYVTRADGNLFSVPFTGGVPTGTATVVSGPGTDGIDWRGRVLFLGPGTPANEPPTARATSSCDELACAFDGSASSDPDGTLQSYAWDFGDGATATGVSPSHTYAAAGDYTVTLTVTDNRGGTDTDTLTVHAAPLPESPIAFRGAASVNKVASSLAVTVPSAVQAGDELLLIATSGTATAHTAPAGWTQRAQRTSSGVLTTIWERTAVSADAGSSVTVTLNSSTKADLHLLAYSGALPAADVQTAAAGSTATHTAPAATVTTAGSWVVRYWADKSSTTTSWTLPADHTQRDVVVGTGTGYISTAMADSGGPVAAGSTGTSVATTNVASSRDVTATIVLPPAE